MTAILLAVFGLSSGTGVELVVSRGDPEALRWHLIVPDGPNHPEAPWRAFLDGLFQTLDRDASRTLTRIELDPVLPLPRGDGTLIVPSWPALDTNRDGRIDSTEFREFYRKTGFGPVSATIRPPTRERLERSAALAQHLDRDRDGVITTAEWQQALTLLTRLDENEDEVLVHEEILVPQGTVIPDSMLVSPLQLAPLRPRPSAVYRIPTTTATGTGTGAAASPGRVHIRFTTFDPTETRPPVGDFYLAQFRDVIGSKDHVTRETLEADASSVTLAALFPYADQDRNARLDLAELGACLNLLDRGIRCQRSLVIEDRGPDLFAILDVNADDRLDRGELKLASQLPRWTLAATPRTVHVQSSIGTLARSFGPLPVPVRKPVAVSPPQSRVGPDWFQALDQNGDGFVSRSEYRGNTAWFRMWDRNQDDRLSVDEAKLATHERK